MDLRQLEVFVHAVHTRSFSRAAQALGVTQSTVSEHIRLLETELRTRLFERVGRETVPTRAAELLQAYAKRLLGLRAQARQALDELAGHLAGELAIGASTIPSEYVLPPIVRRFGASHPDVSIQLRVGDSREIVEAVVAGAIELGVVGAPPGSRKVVTWELMPDELVVAVSSRHAWAGRRQVTLRELRAEPLVVREVGSGSREALERALADAGIRLEDMRVAAQMGSTGVVKQAVRAGVGVSVVSRRAVEEECRHGVLACVTVTDLPIVRHFYVVTHAARSRSPLCQAFLDFLRSEPSHAAPAAAGSSGQRRPPARGRRRARPNRMRAVMAPRGRSRSPDDRPVARQVPGIHEPRPRSGLLERSPAKLQVTGRRPVASRHYPMALRRRVPAHRQILLAGIGRREATRLPEEEGP
jgi:DNA-binding transcriptional LysR family regulator